MTEESINIQPVAGEAEEQVRKHYRVPVLEDGSVVLILGGTRQYAVMDANAEGIGIKDTDGSPGFEIGTKISNAVLSMGGMTFPNLEGKIVHRSFDARGGWMYGLKWQNMGRDKLNRMHEVLARMKKEALSLTDRDVPAE